MSKRKKIIPEKYRRGSRMRHKWAKEARTAHAEKLAERARVKGRTRTAGNFCLHVPEGAYITKITKWNPIQEEDD